MIVNLQKLIPKTRRQISPKALAKNTAHYQQVLRKYGYESRSPKAFDKLAEYPASYAAGHWENEHYDPPELGLMLFGPCGTGKTYAMQIFSGLFKVELIAAAELVRQYAIGGEKQFWEYVEQFKYKPLIIDDIAGEREIKSYGNASPLIDYAAERYRLFKYNKTLTFFTTNAEDRKELKARYGDRIVSRILGMCDPVYVDGKDCRLERETEKKGEVTDD
ncbi:MAG: hypothetical protein GY745_23185 [Actinomycetia bacterium]|nr:hypothetical protein [Actinomycetes bacterium]